MTGWKSVSRATLVSRGRAGLAESFQTVRLLADNGINGLRKVSQSTRPISTDVIDQLEIGFLPRRASGPTTSCRLSRTPGADQEHREDAALCLERRRLLPCAGPLHHLAVVRRTNLLLELPCRGWPHHLNMCDRDCHQLSISFTRWP